MFHSLILQTICLALSVALCTGLKSGYAESPTSVSDGAELIRKYCFDCHGDGADEGGFSLTLEDLAQSDVLQGLEQAHMMIQRSIMPPVDMQSPTANEKESMLGWLNHQLVTNQPIGGTPPRRLSRREYQQTLRDALGINDFKLHDGFPPENPYHGFDNHSETLVTAGSHLEAYAMTAQRIADHLFPPPRPAQPSQTVVIDPKDLVISYSSAAIVDGAMRLASSNPLPQRNATWPSRFVAPQRGHYHVEVEVSAKNPPAETTPTLTLEASDGPKSDMRELEHFQINGDLPQRYSCDVVLDRGQTIFFRYSNGPFDYQIESKLRNFMTDLFAKDPKLAVAWHRLKRPARGGSGWTQLKDMMAQLETEQETKALDQKQLNRLLDDIVRKKVDSGETLVYKFFHQGPNLGIHRVTITGPTETLPDQSVLKAQQLRERLIRSAGKNNHSDDVSAEALLNDPQPFLQALLSKLFRRPPTRDELSQYEQLVKRESDRINRPDAGLHLAVRTALMSPNFLYRSLGSPGSPGRLGRLGAETQLSDVELATRLAYFLTSGPPDNQLMRLANEGKLGERGQLSSQVQRLAGTRFAEDFTQQWLHLKTLETLMPDSRLIDRFDDSHRSSMRAEVTKTFQYVLENNLRVSDLISPDFVFADNFLAKEIYQLEMPKGKRNGRLTRISIPRHSQHGGLLGMAAIMTATANGVDTQPVLRGVWVLENILGSPPPDPPDAVPALTPETTGASTPRDRLALHMSEPNCAVCHREIDPLGFALENFDPIGRWRDHYPEYIRKREKTVRRDGPVIDSSGKLRSGVELSDVRDLKRWLYDNPEPFARCLAEKWLVYAIGRDLNYRERTIVAEIVTELGGQKDATERLRTLDLLKAVVASPIFRTR